NGQLLLARTERRNSAFSDRASKPALSCVKCSGQRRRYRLRQRRRERFARWPRDLPFSPGEFGAIATVGVWSGDQIASFDCSPFSICDDRSVFSQNNTWASACAANRGGCRMRIKVWSRLNEH